MQVNYMICFKTKFLTPPPPKYLQMYYYFYHHFFKSFFLLKIQIKIESIPQ